MTLQYYYHGEISSANLYIIPLNDQIHICMDKEKPYFKDKTHLTLHQIIITVKNPRLYVISDDGSCVSTVQLTVQLQLGYFLAEWFSFQLNSILDLRPNQYMLHKVVRCKN